MNTASLFKVLVMGGAVVAAHSTLANDPGVANGSSDPIMETGFCSIDPPVGCVQNPSDGSWSVKAGFECCWGTSCESE